MGFSRGTAAYGLTPLVQRLGASPRIMVSGLGGRDSLLTRSGLSQRSDTVVPGLSRALRLASAVGYHWLPVTSLSIGGGRGDNGFGANCCSWIARAQRVAQRLHRAVATTDHVGHEAGPTGLV